MNILNFNKFYSFRFYYSHDDEKITILKSDYRKLLKDSTDLQKEKLSNEAKSIKLRQKGEIIIALKEQLRKNREHNNVSITFFYLNYSTALM